MRLTPIPFVVGVAVALAAGCGAAGFSLPQSPMPQGGSFTGVWHSPQYGDMQLVQTGESVVGDYTKDERRGHIEGTARGGVLDFEWTETRELVAGRPTTTRGHGFFRYRIGDDGDHYIQGQWGHDANYVGGGEWNGVRDRRRQPAASTGTPAASSDSNVTAFDSAN
jgi:hypothetical protein